jgi:hypothetical protein
VWKRPSDLGWIGGAARKRRLCERGCRGIFFLFSSQIAAPASVKLLMMMVIVVMVVIAGESRLGFDQRLGGV